MYAIKQLILLGRVFFEILQIYACIHSVKCQVVIVMNTSVISMKPVHWTCVINMGLLDFILSLEKIGRDWFVHILHVQVLLLF